MKEILDVIEKTMLVDDSTNWKPNSSLLMHMASYDDHGAHPETIEENKKLINQEGGKPKKIKMKITVEIEHLET